MTQISSESVTLVHSVLSQETLRRRLGTQLELRESRLLGSDSAYSFTLCMVHLGIRCTELKEASKAEGGCARRSLCRKERGSRWSGVQVVVSRCAWDVSEHLFPFMPPMVLLCLGVKH